MHTHTHSNHGPVLTIIARVKICKDFSITTIMKQPNTSEINGLFFYYMCLSSSQTFQPPCSGPHQWNPESWPFQRQDSNIPLRGMLPPVYDQLITQIRHSSPSPLIPPIFIFVVVLSSLLILQCHIPFPSLIRCAMPVTFSPRFFCSHFCHLPTTFLCCINVLVQLYCL